MPTIYNVIYYRKKQERIYYIKRRLADRYWTHLIKNKRNHTCEKCGTQHLPNFKGLHISHFFARTRELVRFDERNTDLLCMACHLFFSHNRPKYIEWKRKALGDLGYQELYRKARETFGQRNLEIADKNLITNIKKQLSEMIATPCYLKKKLATMPENT